MLLSLLSALLVISTQFHLCFAAGSNKGKRVVNYLSSSSYQDPPTSVTDGQIQYSQLYHPQEHEEQIAQQKIFATREKELLGFARNHLNRKGMTKEEWDQIRAEDPEIGQETFAAYRKQKTSIQRLVRLRRRYLKNPNDPQVHVDAEKYGFSLDDLIKGGENASIPGKKDKRRIGEFMQRLRDEINSINANQGRPRNRWLKVHDEKDTYASNFLRELNHFRDILRLNPFDPQLEPMKDHINSQLKTLYTHTFIPLELPKPPSWNHYNEVPREGENQQVQQEYPFHVQTTSPEGAFQHQDFVHQNQMSDDYYHHTDHMNPNNFHYNPHANQYSPEYHFANVLHQQQQQQESQTEENYAHLHSRMDEMQLNPRIYTAKELKAMEPDQRHHVVHNMFYSDGESENDYGGMGEDYSGSQEE